MTVMASATRFFKIILETCLQDGNLMIPRKFTREYSGNMSNPVFLKTPNGTEWKVHWTKYEADIWFEKGWREFATYYTLKHGYLMVFEYQETCHMEVHIFDTSGLEIKYPSHDPQNEQDHNLDHIINNEFFEVLDEVTPTKKAKQNPPTLCPEPLKKMRTSTLGVVGGSCNLQQRPQHVQINDNQSQDTKFKKSTLPSVKEELNEETNNPCSETEKMDQLTCKIKAVLNRAATFRSNNPSFTVVLQHSYVYGRSLNIPSKFAKRYLKENPMDIELQSLDGSSWGVSYSLGRLYKGWSAFTSDNDLKMLDVCLFELIKSQGICLRVRIFRLSEETRSFLSPGDGVSYIAPGVIPYFRGQTFIPNQVGQVKVDSSKNAKVAMQEARNFISDNPFFKVNIKADHHHDYRPCVPSAFMRNYFSNKKIVLLQFGKILTPVSLLRYADVPTKLSKGWPEFMKESNLLAGDVCVFELINKEDAVLQVHIFRTQP
ncbi:hypothetical protein VNO77_42087 [Canavalia gladiata]|uniref:TF-B3 domain-containing protein n=1 Tax=Canavalia gladiata TaxID=3824 RepID=A0AAN9PQP6_CANGL